MTLPIKPAAAILAGALLTLPMGASAQDASTVLATVGDQEITLGHVIAVQENLPDQYQQLPDDVLYDGILDQLIQQSALAQSLGDNLSQRAVLGLQNERRAFLANVVLGGAAKAAVTDAAVETAYNEQYLGGEAGTEYNAAHILVESEEEAQAIIEELGAGAEFAELAKTKSIGPSGPNGGDLGWFSEGMMVAPFENAVIALEVGAISEPVQTQFGWHVIQLNETRDIQPPQLEEVRAEIVAGLEQVAIQEAIESLTAGVAVERSETEIDPALVRDTSLLD
ncbi:MAG: peptidylprolyl isomerase [Dinoroseobacter sp.]|nr:peptidylprolyl isomerase [Dinoroseobacter sp.]MDJ0995095.1 peptidylprolyl isomerase [Dinoroseobacter sp.]